MSESFGKYIVVERIGEGGFGQVFRGRDPQLKRDVAIKAVSMAAPDARERFPREASIAAGLRHPAIVTIYDFGEQDGVPYLVQEYLSGEDLSRRIARRDAGSLATRLRWLRQIAEGLHYAHGRGVVHRDIKPGNVRILEDGSVRIMDFGIAKALHATSQLTGTNISLGTSGYVAPEQLEGSPIDHRADMFSFGVMAYELVTYQRPFTGDTVSSVLYSILTADPTPILTLVPDCPPRLATCIERCLSKRRDDRFTDMDVVAAELGAVIASLETAGPARDETLTATVPLPGVPSARAMGGAAGSQAQHSSAETGDSGENGGTGGNAADSVDEGTGRQKAVLAVAAVLLIGLTGWAVAAAVGAVRGSTDRRLVIDSVSPVPPDSMVRPVVRADSASPSPEDPNARDTPSDSGTVVTGGSGDEGTGDSADPNRSDDAAGQGDDPRTPPADSSAVPVVQPAIPMEDARVLVMISGERPDAVRAAQSTVLAELLADGRPVVDPDAIGAIRADSAASAALEAGASPAAGVGRSYGAGTVVVAELASDAAPAPGGFIAGSAVLTARFYDSRSGELIMVDTYRVGAGGTAGRPAATESAAVVHAAESAARQLARAILTQTGD